MNDSQQKYEPDNSLKWVMRLIFTVAILAAVLVAWRLRTSQQLLPDYHAELAEQGESLDVSGCVGAVIDWSGRCDAMDGLCDYAVTGMTLACLEASDRSDYCHEVVGIMYTREFGHADCRARDLDRPERAVCADAYRAITGHCIRLEHEDAGT